MNASTRRYLKTASQHLARATEALRKAGLENLSERERTDIARAMFHLGSAYGVLEAEQHHDTQAITLKK